MVSLALVLLVFFLALIAMSSFDQHRQDTAISSLRTTFLQGRPDGISDFNGDTGDIVAPRRSFQNSLTQLFETEFPAAVVDQRSVSDVTQAHFPADALFFNNQPGLRPARLRFFDGIIAALAGAPEGVLFKVEILVATNYDSSKMGAEVPQLVQSRVASIARLMAERGAAPDSFVVGVEKRQAKDGFTAREVTMTFWVAPGAGDGPMTEGGEGQNSDLNGAPRGGVRETQVSK
jgi:hypothetical protein